MMTEDMMDTKDKAQIITGIIVLILLIITTIIINRKGQYVEYKSKGWYEYHSR